jgi:hypothetical protein
MNNKFVGFNLLKQAVSIEWVDGKGGWQRKPGWRPWTFRWSRSGSSAPNRMNFDTGSTRNPPETMNQPSEYRIIFRSTFDCSRCMAVV